MGLSDEIPGHHCGHKLTITGLLRGCEGDAALQPWTPSTPGKREPRTIDDC